MNSFMLPNQPKRNLITILGVQGLSCNDFSTAEIKIALKIIEHGQRVITEYSIPYRISRDSFFFTPEQVAAHHVDVTMRLSELGFGVKHLAWLRDLLEKMEGKKIKIPFKVGDITSYAPFDGLFKSEVFKNRKGIWMVTFRFDTNLLRYFYSFDKGAGRIDLNAINACGGASSMKLYIIMNCWASKGYTSIKPAKLMDLFHGDSHYYTSWSALERKALRFACDDLKRLYDNHIIDQYLTYQPYFEEAEEQQHHHMPEHITFTIHDRKNSGDVEEGIVSQELIGRRCQLKMRLAYRYGVKDEVAKMLSQRLSLDMLGELSDWFLHKDYYIEKCKSEHHKMNTGSYIAKSLDGFFRDKKA